jgi:hypothetical protein
VVVNDLGVSVAGAGTGESPADDVVAEITSTDRGREAEHAAGHEYQLGAFRGSGSS